MPTNLENETLHFSKVIFLPIFIITIVFFSHSWANNQDHSEVCFTNESLCSNKSQVKSFPIQTRWRVNYYSGTQLQLFGGENVGLYGMRFMGNFKKAGRVVSTGIKKFGIIDAKNLQNLGAEYSPKSNNWYAIFAVANPSDDISQFKIMPYVRAINVFENVVTLGEAGEEHNRTDAEDFLSSATYSWMDNALMGFDCLVINENGLWSGRVTTISANTKSSITLTDASGIGPGDFLLPAPPNFTEYTWLMDHYFGNSEWRNIADSGVDVTATMVRVQTVPTANEISSYEAHSLAGYISPLATAVRLSLIYSLSTEERGNVAHNFAHDGSRHRIHIVYDTKSAPKTQTFVKSGIHMPFSRKQEVWLSTAGDLDINVSNRKLLVTGWTLP